MAAKSIAYILLPLAFLMSTGVYSKSPIQNDQVGTQSLSSSDGAQNSLVTAEWLNAHLDDPALVVLDTSVQIDFDENGAMTNSSGLNRYKAGHIPTAGFADLTSDLVDTSSEYPYAIPAPEEFAAAMAALGVGDDSYVVLYASEYSAWAARVWWMLRWIGFDNVAVLDGGLAAWTAAGFQLSTEAADEDEAKLSVSLRPELIAGRDEVFNAINDENVMLIDAMPAAHFRGEMKMYARPGHIPSAINVPTVFAEDGRFLSHEKLVEAHPFARDKRVITYCGGGISASANAFAMHRLGFTDLAVYMNSLEEWATSPENPLSTTSE